GSGRTLDALACKGEFAPARAALGKMMRNEVRVRLGDGGNARQAQPLADFQHLGLSRRFDFHEAAKLRQRVELDGALLDLPRLAAFLEPEIRRVSEALEQL